MSEATTAIATAPQGEAVANFLLRDDLSKLTEPQLLDVYLGFCNAAGLDPRVKPFMFLRTGGKLVLYATKSCAAELCRTRKISTSILSTVRDDQLCIVTARASTPDGQIAENIGAVAIAAQTGEALANAVLKATTKAIRRAVLALTGFGVLDETEAETMGGKSFVPVESHCNETQRKPEAFAPPTPGIGANVMATKEVRAEIASKLELLGRTFKLAAKWISELCNRPIVEPSQLLASEAALVSDELDVLIENQRRAAKASKRLKAPEEPAGVTA